MTDKERLIEYLNKDYWQNVAAFSTLNRFEPTTIYIEKGAVCFLSGDYGLYTIAYNDIFDLKKIIDKLPDEAFCYFCNYNKSEFDKMGITFSSITPCKQFVYKKKTPYVERDIAGFRFAKLDASFAEMVHSHYTMRDTLSVEEVASDLKLNESVGVFFGDELAGFVGMHVEGSMGMLEVIDKYKRNGLATELSKRLTNKILKSGEVPFGHIKLQNTASFNLQTKLENEYSDKLVAWSTLKK